MDSKEGGPEESDSELEEAIGEGIVGELGGEALGKPLPKHRPGHRLPQGGQGRPCGQGPSVLPWVPTGCELQGLGVSPLPKACNHPHPGFCSF